MDRKLILIISAGLLIGAGVGLLIFIVAGLGGDLPVLELLPAGRSAGTILGVSEIAPDFELKDLDGQNVRLSNFQGKPVLINFWATWCGPCRFEMPVIQSRYEKYQDEFEILAVNFDEPAGEVQQFVDELEISFTILLDPGGKIQREYRVRGYPTTYLIDSEGLVRIQHIGFMNESQLDQYLSEIGVSQ